MLLGKHPRIVTGFWAIDHAGDGLTASTPKDGETYIGYPYGWLEVNSIPFVSIVKGGIEIATENMMDMSRVEYLNITSASELIDGDRIMSKHDHQYVVGDPTLKSVSELWNKDFTAIEDDPENPGVFDAVKVYRGHAIIYDKGNQ